MSLVVANNVSALNAQNNLFRSSSALSKSLERLSSGLKINRGADGPAALVISEKQRAQIAGLGQAIQNTEKAVSLVQTAEGALSEINSLLVKVRSLALDSANSGVNDSDGLAANQAEIANALDTIDRIANHTQFGTKKLLDGSAGIQGVASDTDVTVLKVASTVQSGTFDIDVDVAGERANVVAATEQTANLAADEVLTINGVQVSLSAGLTAAQVRTRINEFTGQTGVVAEDDGSGSTQLRTVQYGTAASISAISNVADAADSSGIGTTELTDTGVDIEVTIDGNSFTGVGNTVTGTAGTVDGLTLQFADDTSIETVSGIQGNITVADNSLVFQIGANQNQTVSVTISGVEPTSLGVALVGNQFASLSDIDVTSASKAQDSIAVIDAAIDDVTNLRGTLGAFQQNTLESTSNNLRATLENTTNAESIIRDTDFAEEIANFTQLQVLTQVGTSVLGSANQTTQLALALLNA